MEVEIQFLRKKVKQLESTINTIQTEFQNKLIQVLERFFDHRAEQLSKQRKSLQLEEDMCLDLLSYCSGVPVPLPSADLEKHVAKEPFRYTPSPGPKSKKAKRKSQSKASSDSTNVVAQTGTLLNPDSSKELEANNETEIRNGTKRYDNEKVPPGSNYDEGEPAEKLSKQQETSGEIEDEISNDCEFDQNPNDLNEEVDSASENESEENGSITSNHGEKIVKQEIVDGQQLMDCDDGNFRTTDNTNTQTITINFNGMELHFAEYEQTNLGKKTDRPPIWNYYLREMNGQYAKCLNCDKVLFNRKSTGSLHSHLKGVHKMKVIK